MSSGHDLTMWTVYEPPPGQHCHRAYEWRVADGATSKTGRSAVGPLDVIRGYLFEHLGLTCIPRSPEDEPNVVETWL